MKSEPRAAGGTHRIAFGVGGLTAQAPAGTPDDFGRALSEALDLASAAEDAGLDGVWASEHHFVSDGYLPSPLMLLAAIAARTSRIQIGTQVLLAPLHHRIALAEDAAVLDQLSGGRLVLGLGLGYQGREYAAFGSSSKRRVSDLVRCVETLRTAWSGQPVDIPDDEEQGVIVRPLPCRAGGPPLWLGAIAEAGVRRAARISDGYVAPMMLLPGFRRRLGWLQDEDLPEDFAVGIYIHAFVAERNAWRLAAAGIGYTEGQYGRWQQAHRDFDKFQTIDRSDLARPPDHVIVGTPSEVADQLSPWVEELSKFPGGGERQIIVRLTYPGIGHEIGRESVQLFGAEVAPALRSAFSVPSP